MAGDACVYGSDETCDSGLVCNNMNKCVAYLSETSACKLGQTETDPCDHRLGLACLLDDPSKPNGTLSCQARIIVPDGATCGTGEVDGRTSPTNTTATRTRTAR